MAARRWHTRVRIHTRTRTHSGMGLTDSPAMLTPTPMASLSRTQTTYKLNTQPVI